MRGRGQGDLRQRIGSQHSGGFQPQTRRSEQWTVHPFWELDRPPPAQQQQRYPTGPSAITDNDQQLSSVPMEEGEVDPETDQDPSVLEVPAWNWARYLGVKMSNTLKWDMPQE